MNENRKAEQPPGGGGAVGHVPGLRRKGTLSVAFRLAGTGQGQRPSEEELRPRSLPAVAASRSASGLVTALADKSAQGKRRQRGGGGAAEARALPRAGPQGWQESRGRGSGASEGAGCGGGEKRRRPMGNTLTCCVSPNASPKLGRRAGSAELYCASDIYEAASGDAVAVAPAAVEPAELDFGEGEGHHLQHISDREMPEGKEAADAIRPRAHLCPPPPPGYPGRHPPLRAPSCR
ncbi:hypothetical protein P7K49_013736 [Saguinus oedipus]|uniref:Uncharacterized protein n=1 Tax=Saguinus oedipus TaxID=9490 RepID=A0ABQ9VGZ1_SAGOE|nr:hypothetical protein P7K49_013736 [Saguinus oedipus]